MSMNLWWQTLDFCSKKQTVTEFFKEQNFTWKILSQPCYLKVGDEFIIIPNHQVSVRSDNLKPIAVVKNRYKLLDNEECFKIADEFKKLYPQSYFSSCGDILNYKESYLSMKLKDEIICFDIFEVWLTFSNGFDGRNAVNATLTLIRKKDHCVFQLFNENIPRIWTLGRMNIIKKIEEIHKGIENYIIYAKNVCEKMKVDYIYLNETVKKIFDINLKKTNRINKNLAYVMESVREKYIKEGGKSAYDLYFALSDYFCNSKRLRRDKLADDKRFQSAMIKYFYEVQNYAMKFLPYA